MLALCAERFFVRLALVAEPVVGRRLTCALGTRQRLDAFDEFAPRCHAINVRLAPNARA